MGDTFNAFVKFISDDPIMLGLCIAIIVLVIAFILVLILGRKKDDTNDDKHENTQELLKTEVNLDTLKSTQEYSLSELQNKENLNEQEVTPVSDPLTTVEEPTTIMNTEIEDPKIETSPVIEETPTAETSPQVEEPTPVVEQEAPAIEVPVTTEVPTPLEVPIMDTPNPVIKEETPASVIPTFDSIKIEPEPIMPVNPGPITNSDVNIFDAKEEPIPVVPLDESTVKPIIESSVNPLDETTTIDTNNINPFENKEPVKEEVELPIITAPIPKVEEPFSSVYTTPVEELPSVNTEEFSRTAIIRHIPVMETKTITDDTDLDDLDLPKLNTNTTNNSALGALEGETFNIR